MKELNQNLKIKYVSKYRDQETNPFEETVEENTRSCGTAASIVPIPRLRALSNNFNKSNTFALNQNKLNT